MNGNNIIDWCEANTHSNGFEDFELNDITSGGVHQRGWREFTGASEVVDWSIPPWPTERDQFLVVKKDPAGGDFTMLLSPRLDGAGDGDIEFWSWDMHIGKEDFASLYVEILDICEDSATLVTGTSRDEDGGRTITYGEYPDAANTGLEWRSNIPDPLDPDDVFMYMLQDEAGPHVYTHLASLSSSLDIIPTVVGSNGAPRTYSAGLRIKNLRGETQAFWGPNQDTLLDRIGGDPYDPTFLYMVTGSGYRETQGWQYQTPGNPLIGVRRGGDRQFMIRVNADAVAGNGPSFGSSGTVQFWFDDVRYQTAMDCDRDGMEDHVFLASLWGVGYDQNDDSIPDYCQDCDNDCPTFPIALNEIGCLDPCEISTLGVCDGKAGGNTELDCNNNGIPDICDVDHPDFPDVNPLTDPLPWYGMWYKPFASCFNLCPVAPCDIECFESRLGGGSCDANTNGIPDECEAGADCDSNGCLDAGEIALGWKADADSNGVPDECEPDCNNNGIVDAKDISDATSTDQYPANGALDECCLSAPSGDMDGDGDMDAVDYQLMQRCAGIVAGSYNHTTDPGLRCGCADLNEDGVVDETDVAVFQQVITGPE